MDKTLYVTCRGGTLSKQGPFMIVRNGKGETVQRVPLRELGLVAAFGPLNLTATAARALSRRGTDTLFFTEGGRFLHRLDGFNQKLVDIRIEQYRRSLDPDFRLAASRAMVTGKIENCRTLLMRRRPAETGRIPGGLPHESRPVNDTLTRAIRFLRIASDCLRKAEGVDEVMGVEGSAAAAYFPGFGVVLKQKLGFCGRNRRPPKDPVNAMLSFGYAILLAKVASAVNLAGLDPFISCLHAITPRRPSLLLDLMEEFRPVIVDSTVLGMVNRFVVGSGDFTKDEFTGGVNMSSRTVGRLVSALEARLSEKVFHPGPGRQVQYREALVWQARHYRDFVTGQANGYLPMRIR